MAKAYADQVDPEHSQVFIQHPRALLVGPEVHSILSIVKYYSMRTISTYVLRHYGYATWRFWCPREYWGVIDGDFGVANSGGTYSRMS